MTQKLIPQNWENCDFDTTTIPDKIKKIKLKTTEYQKDGTYPIVDQGIKLISGYTDNSSAVYQGKLPVIIFGDHTLNVKFIDFPFVLGADGTKIINANTEKCIIKFLYYLIQSKNLQSEGYKRHFSKLKKQQFLLPSLPEQQKIVSILTNIDVAIENTNKILTTLHHLEKGLMQKLFTRGINHTKFKKIKWFFGNELEIPQEWTIKSCKEISTQILDGEHNSPKFSKEGIPYISAQHVKSTISFSDCKYVSSDTYQKIAKRCNSEYSDLLITVKGTIGFCKLIDITTKFCMDRNVGLIKPNSEIDPVFLEKIMKSEIVQRQIRMYTEKSVIPSLYLNKIKKILLPIPSLPEQQKISFIFSNIEFQIQNEKNYLSKLKFLQNELMRQLHSGKLLVQI